MPDDLRQQIGDYEILGELGAGGMGKVYRVRNTISDRVEAMKILLPSLSGHRDVAERFLREIKLVASLHHPNIANLCTAQTLDNALVMVMEYVEGDTFSDLLDHRAVPLSRALNYFDQALAALSYAHAKGIVHRDIKPSNIMLTPDGVVKLMDFGIARNSADRALTQTGATIGTVDYMSPEQIAGRATDGRSDLYSMGIFLYETITGEQPFRGTSDYELMAAHMNQAPRPPAECVPGIPDALNEIILKLLAKEPERRFQTADETRSAIRALDVFDATVVGLPRSQKQMRPPLTELDPLFPANPSGPARQQRPATVVEAQLTSGSQRMPTMMEQPNSGTLVRDAYTDRRMTELSGVQSYAPAPAPALVVRKKGLARHPALYLGAGLAIAAGAASIPLARSHHADDDKKSVAAALPLSVLPASGSPPSGTPPTPPGASAAAAKPGGPPPAGPIHASALPSRSPAGSAMPSTPNAGKSSSLVLAGSMHGSATIAGAPAPAAAAPPPLSPELKARLDSEETEIDGLDSRAVAINNSLNTMQRSMQKDGVSMRGDIAGKQASMNLNLSKAKQALAVHDADRAGKFAALAQTEEGDLEAFLGR